MRSLPPSRPPRPIRRSQQIHRGEAMAVGLTAERVSLVLGAVAALLTVVGLGSMLVKEVFGRSAFGFLHLFDLSWDGNIPTWYASVLLLLCGGLLALIARVKWERGGAYRMHWAVLSGIFFLLSIDETATIHERAGEALGRIAPQVAEFGGVLSYSWVILGGLFVGLVGLAYLRFLMALSQRFQRLFVMSGAVYVGGALVMEMVNAQIDDSMGHGVVYILTTTVEEAMEMAGAVLFIYALLAYVRAQVPAIRFTFGRTEHEPM